ncbi:hypothetical protein GEMRC1_007408 [Eukaryota sp. GEM-RC1]
MGSVVSRKRTDDEPEEDLAPFTTSSSEPLPTPNLRCRLDSIAKSVTKSQLSLLDDSPRATSNSLPCDWTRSTSSMGSSASTPSLSKSMSVSALLPLPTRSVASSLSLTSSFEDPFEVGKVRFSISGIYNNATFSSSSFGDYERSGEFRTLNFSTSFSSDPTPRLKSSHRLSVSSDDVTEQPEWFFSLNRIPFEGPCETTLTAHSPSNSSFKSDPLPCTLTYNVFKKVTTLTLSDISFPSPSLFISSLSCDIKWKPGEFLYFFGEAEYDYDGWGGITKCKLIRFGSGWKISLGYQLSVSHDTLVSVHFPSISQGESSGTAQIEVVATRVSFQRVPPSINLTKSSGECDYQSNLTEEGVISITVNGEVGDEFLDFPFSFEFNGKLRDQSTDHLDNLVMSSWESEADDLVKETSALNEQNLYAEAEAKGLALWRLLKNNVPADHERVASVTRLLGEALLGQNKLNQAEGLLRHSVNILENSLETKFDDDELNQSLSESLFLLGRCCNIKNKPKEAMFYLLMAEDVVSTSLPLNKLVEQTNGLKLTDCFDEKILHSLMETRRVLLDEEK